MKCRVCIRDHIEDRMTTKSKTEAQIATLTGLKGKDVAEFVWRVFLTHLGLVYRA